jgi:hypothetical protein
VRQCELLDNKRKQLLVVTQPVLMINCSYPFGLIADVMRRNLFSKYIAGCGLGEIRPLTMLIVMYDLHDAISFAFFLIQDASNIVSEPLLTSVVNLPSHQTSPQHDVQETDRCYSHDRIDDVPKLV